jgi:5-methyltetrahydrofolate--homocysteine methyltransferase
MTKVKIEEYYQQWSEKLTIWGGIPSNLLLAESTTDDEFEAYLDHLFRVVAPGRRLILGIADTTPPNAVFERLIRIGERVEKEARLPLQAGAARPISGVQMAEAARRLAPRLAEDKVLKEIQQDVIKGDHLVIQDHIQEMLQKGIKPKDILKRGMLAAMEVVGERFKVGDVFIPEVLLSARAMNEGLKVLEPYLAGESREESGKIIMCTVWGDLHDIGKNMVTMMLRGVGFEVKDLGINVPREEILRAVSEYKPDILGLSALLTTTMPEMKKVVEALKESGLRQDVKVMVGGAPVNEKFARDIGADGYAPDAGEAVTLARQLIKGV